MNKFKSLFLFDRRQQRGIFILLLILCLLAFIKWFTATRPREALAIQDMSRYQSRIDSIERANSRKRDTIYAFNPNYITDYRAYVLGLSEIELERLSRFRESGKFINSAAQFQKVTKVSDQWIDSIAPYFKFPSWVNSPKNNYRPNSFNKNVVPSNINAATQDKLREVYGIGPALSGRILKERERLGGFIDISQVAAIYGLTDSTMVQLQKHFYVKPVIGFTKFALNKATRDQLSTIPYLNDYLIDKLLEQRTLRDGFKSWDEVLLTSRFPEEKLALIQLYLTLD